jgi:hypothetical protein
MGTIPGPAWGPTAPCCSDSLFVSEDFFDEVGRRGTKWKKRGEVLLK